MLGVVHIQRMLREPASSLLGGMLDGQFDDVDPTDTLEDVARHLTTYNLVAAPVLDEEGRLLGVVTVDDLLDHLLPENWRDNPPSGSTTLIRDATRAAAQGQGGRRTRA
jgi:Mg/Co/Ni transporter MgtE